MKNKPKKKPAILWQPKIDLISGASEPDSYDGRNGLVPPDDFVVTRDRDGNPVSRYGFLFWDISAYHPHGESTFLHFHIWGKSVPTRRQRRLIREMWWLMFCLIWKRPGSSLAVGTLVNYLKLMRVLARFSHDHGCRIENVLCDLKIMRNFEETCHKSHFQLLASLLTMLMQLGEREVGYTVLGGLSISALRAKKEKYAKSLKQHPPLPTRIYSALITNTLRRLDVIEAVIDRYLIVLARYLEKRRNLVGKRPDGALKEYVQQLLTEQGLTEFFNDHNLAHDHMGLSSGLTMIQEYCRLTVAIFSGARPGEGNHLPYHCIEVRRRGGKRDYLLHGYTTKLNQGRRKDVTWVTSADGDRAVRIAQQVADLIYDHLGDKPKKTSTYAYHYPLFVSPAYLRLTSVKTPRTAGGGYRAAVTLLEHAKTNMRRCQFIDDLFPVIEEQDLRELEMLDPHRAWRSEKNFQVGKRWNLTKHQLRRTLALYASNSGLISLPSLRRQLQHITESMTRYYARGSSLARSIIRGNKEHFGTEYQNTQPVSQALSFLMHALYSDATLFGGIGAFLERHAKTEGKVNILETREKTLKEFKNGSRHYKETMLGGCGKIGPCDQRALRSIVGCLGCKDSIIKLPNLIRVIHAQEKMLSRLDPESVEYRNEQKDLEILKQERARIEGKADNKETKHVKRKRNCRR